EVLEILLVAPVGVLRVVILREFEEEVADDSDAEICRLRKIRRISRHQAVIRLLDFAWRFGRGVSAFSLSRWWQVRRMLAERVLFPPNSHVREFSGGRIPGMRRPKDQTPPVPEPRESGEVCSFAPADPIDKEAKMMTLLGFATNMRFPRN